MTSSVRALDRIVRQVRVDYSEPLSSLLLRAEYNFANVDQRVLDAELPSSLDCPCRISARSADISLVRFDRLISTEEVEESFAANGIGVGTAHEYLSLVADCPELRTYVPAICLGSVALRSNGVPGAVSASNDFKTRRIGLGEPHTGKWGWLAWFVAVDLVFDHYEGCDYK